MLRPFGCLAYADNLIPHRGKFDSRSIKCVFIGYDICHKRFLMFDLDSEKVFVYGDVKFILVTFLFLQKHVSHIEPPVSYPAVSAPTDMEEDFIAVDHDSTLIDFQSLERLSTSRPSPPTSPIHNDIPAQEQVLRKGSRLRQFPVWMQDYIGSVQCLQLITPPVSITPPTFPYTISPSLSKTHISYLFNLSMVREPSSFKEAIQHPQWMDAINAELQAVTDNHTWIITDLPPDKMPIGCKWIFKIKLKADGSVERYKARLVAKGYTHEHGVDYLEVFSPVANLATVKMFIAVAALHS